MRATNFALVIRQMFFLETPLLASPASTTSAGIPPLVVIHHIIVRSSQPLLALPHALQDPVWTEAEYVRWLEEHPNEKERLTMIEGCLPKWDAEVKKRREKEKEKNDGKSDDVDYVALVRSVLENARSSR